jgi:DNA-binding transcriptional ArsR family regulator
VDRFVALADPTRRCIVELLAERERSAGDIAARFSISQPAVSRHLRLLRECGLVSVRPMAQQRIYSLETQQLNELADWVARTRELWMKRFDAMDEEILRGRREAVTAGDKDRSERGDES